MLTKKIPDPRYWRRSGDFIVNFEHILNLFLVFLFFNFEHVNVNCFDFFQEHFGQSIQKWTKENFWKTAFKKLGCLPQILLGPFLNTLPHLNYNLTACLEVTNFVN